MSKLGKTDFSRDDSDAELHRQTAADEDLRGIPADWHERARLERGAPMPPLQGGRAIRVELDADVIDFFQSGGRGWQTRMNSALRAFMDDRRRSPR